MNISRQAVIKTLLDRALKLDQPSTAAVKRRS
jgi:hypothetical protein